MRLLINLPMKTRPSGTKWKYRRKKHDNSSYEDINLRFTREYQCIYYFKTRFPSGAVEGEADLGRFEMPHDFQQFWKVCWLNTKQGRNVVTTHGLWATSAPWVQPVRIASLPRGCNQCLADLSRCILIKWPNQCHRDLSIQKRGPTFRVLRISHLFTLLSKIHVVNSSQKFHLCYGSPQKFFQGWSTHRWLNRAGRMDLASPLLNFQFSLNKFK